MDRRYVCTTCGTKWFIPASRPDEPELTICRACDGELVPLEQRSSGASR